MTVTGADARLYAMGYSTAEQRRLARQAALLGPSTRQLLVDAGIEPGMRVLDVGCGVGDVTLLAAELAGPQGTVVGVDIDARQLATARQRAAPAGAANVEFTQANVFDFAPDVPFDAVVGRLLLIHLADPVAGLRHLVSQVRPGGVVAFQEYDFTTFPSCFPTLPLWERTGALAVEALRRAGADTRMGLKLHQTFHAAGLPTPRLRLDVPVESGPDSLAFAVLTETVRSLLPVMERFEIATADEIDVATLELRLRQEVVALDGVVLLPFLVGASAQLSTGRG